MNNSKEIEKLKREVEERKLKIESLLTNQNKFESLPENYKLAEKIHSKTCSWNHTDGCSWEYENWDGKLRQCRSHYVVIADRVLKKVPYEMAAMTLDNI